MKVAVSAIGKDLNGTLDARFGRCQEFVIVDTRDMSFEAIHNIGATYGGGSGIEAAHSLTAKGVKAVITGRCGPNAAAVLDAAGIQIYEGQSGKIQEVVDLLNQGKLTPSNRSGASTPSAQPRGMGGRGMGGGGGMGMGGGGGGGMGRGGQGTTR